MRKVSRQRYERERAEFLLRRGEPLKSDESVFGYLNEDGSITFTVGFLSSVALAPYLIKESSLEDWTYPMPTGGAAATPVAEPNPRFVDPPAQDAYPYLSATTPSGNPALGPYRTTRYDPPPETRRRYWLTRVPLPLTALVSVVLCVSMLLLILDGGVHGLWFVAGAFACVVFERAVLSWLPSRWSWVRSLRGGWWYRMESPFPTEKALWRGPYSLPIRPRSLQATEIVPADTGYEIVAVENWC